MEERPGDDRPQLPPPSLWPVGFAVGIVCLLVGLIVSWPAVAVGAVLALVFGFLWARDVAERPRARRARRRRRSRAAERRRPRRRAGAGRALPAQHASSRARRSASARVIGAIVTLPAVGFALAARRSSSRRQHEGRPRPDRRTSRRASGWSPPSLRDPTQGEISRRTAFIRNNGLLDGEPSFTDHLEPLRAPRLPGAAGRPALRRSRRRRSRPPTARSTLIPSLPAAGFICPCHGGSYDQEGNRIAGPPVRGLDRYEFDIVNGRLVLGNTYSVADGRRRRARTRRSTSTSSPARASTSTAPSPGSTRCSRRTDGEHEASRTRARSQSAAMYPLDWLEERSGLVGGLKYFLFRKVPGDTSWWHTLGSATLTAFLVQLVTGVILAMYYKPSPGGGALVGRAHHERPLGRLARARHAPLGRERLHHPDVLAHGRASSCSAPTSTRAS